MEMTVWKIIIQGADN